MINIKEKNACCGCQACKEVCPTQCISMVVDNEGFLYPKVRQADCLDCHLCEKACPQLKEADVMEGTPTACYAAISKDTQARLLSSSGGVFSLLAESIIKRGGVVFGARFDDRFTVFHSYTETCAEIAPFRGSKYSQSDLRGSYSQVHQFLKEKRPVLFTGTPCQIAGLRGYLQHKDDDNLFLVSVVCHGAPSPLVWKEYLMHVTNGAQPTEVIMRDKTEGWSRYKMVITRDNETCLNTTATDTPFMRAFLSNLTLRPSCYSCQFRGNHRSDLMLGDYWGIEDVHPDMSDDNGTSLILVYTAKGQQLLSGLNLKLKESRYEDAIKGNPSIIYPAYKPVERALFWRAFRRHGAKVLQNYTTENKKTRVRRLWARLLRKLRIE